MPIKGQLFKHNSSMSAQSFVFKDKDGSTRTLTAAWVGGCDGGRSAVRELVTPWVRSRLTRAEGKLWMAALMSLRKARR